MNGKCKNVTLQRKIAIRNILIKCPGRDVEYVENSVLIKKKKKINIFGITDRNTFYYICSVDSKFRWSTDLRIKFTRNICQHHVTLCNCNLLLFNNFLYRQNAISWIHLVYVEIYDNFISYIPVIFSFMLYKHNINHIGIVIIEAE